VESEELSIIPMGLAIQAEKVLQPTAGAIHAFGAQGETTAASRSSLSVPDCDQSPNLTINTLKELAERADKIVKHRLSAASGAFHLSLLFCTPLSYTQRRADAV
jgi:hypothetical protein